MDAVRSTDHRRPLVLDRPLHHRLARTIDAIPVTLESVKNLSDETCQLQLSIPFGYDGNTNGREQEEVLDLMRRGLGLFDAAGRRLVSRPSGMALRVKTRVLAGARVIQ